MVQQDQKGFTRVKIDRMVNQAREVVIPVHNTFIPLGESLYNGNVENKKRMRIMVTMWVISMWQ